MKNDNNITKRLKFTEMEKKFMIQLLSVFDENRDEMYYDIDHNLEAKKAFDDLCIACGYSNDSEMDSDTVDKCLKILGS